MTDELEKTEETTEKTEEKTEEKQEEYTKEKQRADQEAANAKRAREERDRIKAEKEQLAIQVEETTTQLEETKTAVSELQAKIQAAEAAKETVEDELDPDMNDPKLIAKIKKFDKTIKDLSDKLDKAHEKVGELEKAKKGYEEREAKDAETARRNEAKEKILSRLDKKFSPKYRNEAVKRLQKAVDDGEIDVPSDRLDAYLKLEEIYAELAKEDSPAKDTVRTDTGTGGISFGSKKVKEGPLNEVLPEIMEEFQGKEFSMPGE